MKRGWKPEDELANTGGDDIRPDVKAEVLRRRDEALAHPELMEPWDGTMDKARGLMNELRPRKPVKTRGRERGRA